MIVHIDGIDRTGKDSLRRKLHDKHFIFVRSYFSHIVYSRLFNRNIDENFYFNLINKRIEEGEFFVILKVNKEEFTRRCILTNEEHVTSEDYVKHNTTFNDVIEAFEIKYNKKIITIDTSTISTDEVYEQLINQINFKKESKNMSKKEFLKEQYSLFETLIKEKFNITDSEIEEFLKEVEIEFSKEPDKSRFFKKWYEDFSYDLYSDKYYLFAGWLSFKKWSSNHIKLLSKLDINPESIIDFGCGIGFSTKLLQDVFPDSKVICTNIPDTLQTKMCEFLNLNIETDYSKLPQCDLAFCSEYFEHFKEPVDHCRLIIEQCSPKYLIIANSFGTNAVGHFNSYFVEGFEYSKKKTSRVFNKFLREKGYVQIKTKFWNNRPSVWQKI